MTGANLRQRRKAMSFTQTDLARVFGCTKQSIYNWETGRKPMPAWVKWAVRGLEAARVV